MRQLLIALLFASFLFPASGQNNVFKTAGVSYTIGAPTFSPGKYGSQVAIDTVTGLWYEHNGTSWSASGYRMQTISGCSAPAYTPAKYQSRLVINACTVMQGGPELYYWNGSAWLQINEGQTYTAGTGIDITGGVISATGDGSGGTDSTFAKTSDSYTNKRITDNVYKNGTLGLRTIDTTGVVNINSNSLTKPGQYTLINGTGYRQYEQVKNPSLGWQGTRGNWYEGAINNGTSQNGSANYAPGVVADTLPNVVWRRGQNWQQFPALFESDETNWWGGGVFGETNPHNVYEKHWQMKDSANFEHRPLTGYFEKKVGGRGGLVSYVSLFAIAGWRYGQDARLTLNRNSESRYGQASFFRDSLYTLNLSDLSQNSVLHLAAANRVGTGDPTGKSNFLTIGGNGVYTNVVGIGSLYANNNPGGDLDMILTTPQSGVSTEAVRIKGGSRMVGINSSTPLQTLDVGGTTLHRGGVRVNMVGDSAALTLKYSSSQTSPILKLQRSNGADIISMHVYNETINPSLVIGNSTVAAGASSNTVVGFTSAQFPTNAGNNTIVGSSSGNSMNGAYQNTYIGSFSGQSTTTGFSNFAGGYLALRQNTEGYQNMALGPFAMQNSVTGFANSAVGVNSLRDATSPFNFVAVGSQSAQSATTASSSVVLGGYSAVNKTTITGSVIIGSEVASTAGTGVSIVDQLWIDNSNTSTPLIGGNFANNSVGINTAPGSIAASAAFEITSTTKGFLPPRMTTAQRDAIASPATGLTLYCTDCTATDASKGVMQTYNGAAWKNNW